MLVYMGVSGSADDEQLRDSGTIYDPPIKCLRSLVVVDATRGPRGSSARGLFGYLVSRHSYGFVPFGKLARLEIPSNQMGVID